MSARPPVSPFTRPVLIINEAAGSTSDITQAAKDIAKAHGHVSLEVSLTGPDGLDAAIAEAVETGADLLISYGGDGTARAMAAAASQNDIPFIPLPGGTMNMLCKALYGTDDWEECLQSALAQPAARWLPAGQIGDHTFYVGAIIGNAARFQSVREHLRETHIKQAAKETLETLSDVGVDDMIRYQLEGSPDMAPANIIVASCPGMSPQSGTSDTAFELAAISTDTAFDVVRLGLTALIKNWRDDASTQTAQTQSFTVQDKADIDVLMDGEYHSFPSPVRAKLIPKGVKVLAPDSLPENAPHP